MGRVHGELLLRARERANVVADIARATTADVLRSFVGTAKRLVFESYSARRARSRVWGEVASRAPWCAGGRRFESSRSDQNHPSEIVEQIAARVFTLAAVFW